MKQYKKRIAFIISSQHFIIHGGIGTFARAFVDMCNDLDYKVDYIMDKAPANKDLEEYILKNNGNILYPYNDLSYKGHNARFVFSDSMNLEKTINFRDSFLQSFKNAIYDVVIVNSNDAILPILITGIQSIAPTIVYSHSGELVFVNEKHDPVFKKSVVEIYKQLMCLDDIIIGTHSDHNKAIIENNFPNINVKTLPLRIADKGLLDSIDPNIEKNGVLFVGRYEPRKNPDTFLKAVSEAGLKMLIMTNDNGAKKFESKLLALGYEKFNERKNDPTQNDGKVYEIKYGIFGNEKESFMNKAKLSFQPAILESYAYSTVEALHCCRTVVLDEYSWGKNFKGLAYFTNKKTMSEDLKRWHDEEYDMEQQLEKMRKIYNDGAQYWTDIFEEYSALNLNPKKVTKTKLYKILDNQKNFVSISYILETLLNRDLNWIAIDDAEIFYKIINELDIIHTDKETFIALKNKKFKFDISDEVDGSELLF